MAQDIEIANAQYNDVPSIEVPKQGGGTASFVDTTDADAIASEIDMGKTAYVNGIKLTGTRSGGGSSYSETVLFSDASGVSNTTIPLNDSYENYDIFEIRYKFSVWGNTQPLFSTREQFAGTTMPLIIYEDGRYTGFNPQSTTSITLNGTTGNNSLLITQITGIKFG